MTVFRPTSTLWLAMGRSHEWLLAPKSAPFPSALSAAMKQAGISRVAFLRHGRTTAKPAGGSDWDRQLTDQGRRQVEEAGISFGRDLTPFYPRLFVSPSARTKDTLDIFLESSMEEEEQKPSFTYVDDAVLYDGTMRPLGSALFRKLGYSPLQDYLNATHPVDRAQARKILGAYAYDVSTVFMDTIMMDHLEGNMNEQPRKERRNSTLLFVGHAIYMPAVALSIASMVGCGGKLILSTNTLEAEGYLIDLDQQTTSLLERPKGASRVHDSELATA